MSKVLKANRALENLSKLENKNWTPPLRLTVEEKISVAKDGNVLLLGRSGTGKTISIANRISHDRERVDENISFKQLFIARSKRICNYVTELVEDDQEINSRKNHFAEYSTFSFGIFIFPSPKTYIMSIYYSLSLFTKTIISFLELSVKIFV